MFHVKLQAAMKAKGFTAAGLLAELERFGVAVQQQSVQLWIDGERMPRARNLPAIAAVLGVSVDELLPEAERVCDPA